MAIFLGTSLLFFFFFSWSLIVSLLSFFVVFFFSFVPLSLNYYLNMCYFDSLSYFMCILSLWVGLMMISASYGIYKTFLSNGVYSFLILSLVYILLLSFLVNNMLSFYFFFECSLIPTFLIVMGWGYQPERLQASVYLLFYTLFASLPLLVVIILMDKIMGSLTLCLVPCMVLSEGLIGGIFMFFTIFAFLVKMPLYIFHMWLPKAHVEAPVAGSMILAGVLLKLGGYGIYRMSFYFIYYYKLLSHYLLSLSLMSMVVVGFICCRMNDLKALVAYSSVSHMGLVLAGVITFSLWGMSGGFAMMVAHGLCSSGLFCLINMFYERFSTRSIFLIKGMSLILPSLTLLMFLLMMSNMAAPPTINLLSEILLMYSILDYSWMILLVFPLGSFLGAVFSIFMFSFSQHGKFSLSMASVYLSTPRELHLMVLHLFPINFLILFGGLLLF